MADAGAVQAPVRIGLRPFNIDVSGYVAASTTKTDQKMSPVSSQGDGGPPANQAEAASAIEPVLLPASWRDPDDMVYVPCMEFTKFLASELNVEKLNRLHDMFWMVGRPMPPRPLHYQRTLSRDIYITEKMNMHLVWTIGRIYVKPVPRFLLRPEFWTEHLTCKRPQVCAYELTPSFDNHDRELGFCSQCRHRRTALGFLLSYAALIPYESDFQIAKHNHLLPEGTAWQDWKTLVADILSIEHIHKQINPRFIHGELRLSRLNKLYRFYLRHIFRGYAAGYNRYGDFLNDNFASLASVTIYIALVLTAMQVGLGTNELRDNAAFSAASYGFTVFAIVAPIAITLVILMAVFVWVFVNTKATLAYRKKRMTGLGLMPPDEKKAAISRADPVSTV